VTVFDCHSARGWKVQPKNRKTLWGEKNPFGSLGNQMGRGRPQNSGGTSEGSIHREGGGGVLERGKFNGGKKDGH